MSNIIVKVVYIEKKIGARETCIVRLSTFVFVKAKALKSNEIPYISSFLPGVIIIKLRHF